MAAESNVDLVVAERFFKGRRGVFVDVGAGRPDYLSVSAHFRTLDWRVIAVEPNPEFCEIYRQAGHTVLQYACGETDQDDVDFTVVNTHGVVYEGGLVFFESFSSLSVKPSYAALNPNLDKRIIKVKLRRLETILREHAPDVDRIDVLSVDVEGWEIEVLRGLNLARYRPGVMIIENVFDDLDYRRFAIENGYVVWRILPPNDVYVAVELLGAFARAKRAFAGWVEAIRKKKLKRIPG
jgi:FkbM family methyltransferase